MMKLEIIEINGNRIAQLISDDIEINKTQDALDLLGNCFYLKSRKVIINEKNITPGFFDLKMGIAGEILQKFSTYYFQLAIVGDFSKYQSKVLKDFIYESNKMGRINFVNSIDEAKEKLIK